jgi:hypothetical protein
MIDWNTPVNVSTEHYGRKVTTDACEGVCEVQAVKLDDGRPAMALLKTPANELHLVPLAQCFAYHDGEAAGQ